MKWYMGKKVCVGGEEFLTEKKIAKTELRKLR